MALPQHHDQEQESKIQEVVKDYVKKQVRKQAGKLIKKIVKKGMKLAAKAALKFGAVLVKTIIAALSGIGLPVILIVAGVILVVIIFTQVSSFLFATGEELTGEDRKMHEYIVEQADKTVDMSNPVEREYRVPHELIASIIQLDIMKNDDYKSIAKDVSQALKPIFEYDKFNEWTETKTQVCEDGKCGKWSDVKRTDNWVSKLVNVDYWNGHTTFTYTPYVTNWETDIDITYKTVKYEEEVEYQDEKIEKYIEYEEQAHYVTVKVPYVEYEYQLDFPFGFPQWILKPVIKYREEKQLVVKKVPVVKEKRVPVTKTKTVTKEKKVEVKTITMTRHQKFSATESSNEDYSNFDSILNSFGFGLNDKRLVEANFLLAGGESNYLQWLENYSYSGSYIGFNGTIIPGDGVPAQFMQYYLNAEKEYGVPWYVLAAIHFVETGFSTHPTMISYAGAIGPMQFMAATWVGWKYNIGGGRVSKSLDITSLSVIASGNGYGTDGDGDGKADPFNEADSIMTAAKYLAKNGYAEDPRKAIFAYNHADWYVNKVLKYADKFKSEAIYQPAEENMPEITDGAFMRPTTGTITSHYGPRDGRMHHGVDIGKNGRKGNVPIVAAADGIVVRSYYSSSYGNCVIIRHNINGQQYETLYAHMENRAVREGQTVTKGQFLGYMGNTGNSFGAHLHFEVHVGSWNPSKSNSVNPLYYIPAS